MVSITSSMVAIPSFTGLKLNVSSKPMSVSISVRTSTTAMASKLVVKSSMKDFVAKGEKICFKNNAGFPHNVVFDENEISSGVDASKFSLKETGLLNAKGEIYDVTLTERGSYSFYCVPHQGAGMFGKLTVK